MRSAGTRARSVGSRQALRAVGLAGTLGLGLYGFQIAKYRRVSAKGFEVAHAPAPGDAGFGHLIESLTGAPLRDGNRVVVLRNGDEIFPAMLDAIRGARHCIDFSTYVYWTGGIADEFADALCERAKAGVEVNILLDAVGAAKMNRDLVTRLREAGARAEWFRPPRWYTVHKANHRSHRKILVVDGAVGFTGGVGIADEWTGDAQDADHWRDTHALVEGPAVRDLFGGFQENWAEATGCILTDSHLPELHAFEEGHEVQVTRSSASHGSTDAEELFFAAIAAAKERLWITSAYFAPRTAFIDDLGDAAARGVDVRVLANGPRTDKEVVRQAGRQSYGALLDRGVRVYEYQQTMLHAKVMTIDGTWASVGSINFDNRSFALNDELNLSITDREVVTTLERQFLADLEVSIEMTDAMWQDRTVRKRIVELSAALIRREL